MAKYEYVVWDNIDNEIHRGPESEQWCRDWLEETKKMLHRGTKMLHRGTKVDELWSIRRRAVGEWETYDA